MSAPGPRPSRVPGPAVDVDVRRGAAAAPLSSPESLSPRLRTRRAYTLLALTLLAPGSAQHVAGNRRVGSIALRVWLAALAAVVLLGLGVVFARPLVLGMVRSWVLTGLSAVLVVLALGWAALVVDALRLARIPLLARRARRGVAAMGAALLVVTVGGLGLAARNVHAAGESIGAVFGGNTTAPPSNGRYNILLMGGDSGADRDGTRPDTLMLASVDAETGRSVVFGFARDTENINFRPGSTMAQLMPEGWNCGDECLLNALYQWGTQNRDRFPPGTKDPGAVATVEAVEALSGLDIQYHVLVDLKGFQRLVDAVGGLDVDVRKRTPIGGGTSRISGWIEPGVQHLDGYHALWYARSREGSSNYERMARQRCVMTSMLHQLSPQTVIFKFKDLAGVSGSIFQTDIPDSDLGTLADLAIKARGQKIKAVNFVPPLINPWKYDPGVIRDKVRQTIEASQGDASAPTAVPSARPSAKAAASPRTPGSSSSTPGSSRPAGAGDSTATDDLSTVCAPL